MVPSRAFATTRAPPQGGAAPVRKTDTAPHPVPIRQTEFGSGTKSGTVPSTWRSSEVGPDGAKIQPGAHPASACSTHVQRLRAACPLARVSGHDADARARLADPAERRRSPAGRRHPDQRSRTGDAPPATWSSWCRCVSWISAVRPGAAARSSTSSSKAGGSTRANRYHPGIGVLRIHRQEISQGLAPPHPEDQPFMAIAGIWREQAGNQPPAFTMLTTAPGPDVSPYRPPDRGPASADWAARLYLSKPEAELLRPLPRARSPPRPCGRRATSGPAQLARREMVLLKLNIRAAANTIIDGGYGNPLQERRKILR